VTAVEIALAGALGAALRYLLERQVSAKVRREWPWGTFAVNVSGCLALGALSGTGHVHTVLGVGLVGSYTTFSAYAVEVVRVDADRHRAAAVAYALGSVGAGVLAAGLGLWLGRIL
jgi:CrcB protein